MKPSPFVGISPPPMGATQRYLKPNPEPSSLKLVCMILFVLTGFNTLFAILMVYKNALVIEENTRLIQENQQLLRFQQSLFIEFSQLPILQNPVMDGDSDYDLDTERFAKLVDIRLPQDCPPCTTETPTIVQPHKNPVSILNEVTQKTDYECEYVCLNPPIHIATLKIQEEHLDGKSWTGKGRSKSASKQVSAYRGIEEAYPHHLDSVAEEHIPDLEYNPTCLTKPPSTFDSRAKC